MNYFQNIDAGDKLHNSLKTIGADYWNTIGAPAMSQYAGMVPGYFSSLQQAAKFASPEYIGTGLRNQNANLMSNAGYFGNLQGSMVADQTNNDYLRHMYRTEAHNQAAGLANQNTANAYDPARISQMQGMRAQYLSPLNAAGFMSPIFNTASAVYGRPVKQEGPGLAGGLFGLAGGLASGGAFNSFIG